MLKPVEVQIRRISVPCAKFDPIWTFVDSFDLFPWPSLLSAHEKVFCGVQSTCSQPAHNPGRISEISKNFKVVKNCVTIHDLVDCLRYIELRT